MSGHDYTNDDAIEELISRAVAQERERCAGLLDLEIKCPVEEACVLCVLLRRLAAEIREGKQL